MRAFESTDIDFAQADGAGSPPIPRGTHAVRAFRYPLDRVGDDTVVSPIEWAHLQASFSALDLEIGCGVGMHPVRRALAQPDRALIAVEHTAAKFEKFAGRVGSHREKGHALSNLIPLHLNAIDFVTRWAPKDIFDTVFLLYPNPHPKEKQSNQRWLRMPFFGRLLESVKPGGRIVLATNIESYWNEANEFALLTWGLEVESDRVFTSIKVPPYLGRTHFERKTLERGGVCYESVWIKPLNSEGVPFGH
jgi:tRNA (guanine-N7-)-methyltransferase